MSSTQNSRNIFGSQTSAAGDLGQERSFLIPAVAEAFRKDLPSAKVQFLDTGHFALETHVVEIASAMREFLRANVIASRDGEGKSAR